MEKKGERCWFCFSIVDFETLEFQSDVPVYRATDDQYFHTLCTVMSLTVILDSLPFLVSWWAVFVCVCQEKTLCNETVSLQQIKKAAIKTSTLMTID